MENILPHTWNTWEYCFHFVTLYSILNVAMIIDRNQSKEEAKFCLSVKNLRRPIIKIQSIFDLFNARNEVLISLSTVCSFSWRKTNRSSLQKSISHYTFSIFFFEDLDPDDIPLVVATQNQLRWTAISIACRGHVDMYRT